MLLLKTLLAGFAASQLSPLEQEDGKGLLFGNWCIPIYPAITQRLNHKPFIFWQSDVNISASNEMLTAMDQFARQIDETNTPAFYYLTVYPIDGFEQVTDAAISNFARKVKEWTDKGKKVMIRYASEMNGSWFKYGQTPTLFIREWNRLVNAVRAAAGRENVSFLWAPNSGNGYPYAGGQSSNSPNSTFWDATLDTNRDGLFNNNDDPFTPYYPGDDMVDWVGMSIYHYGDTYPYDKNVIPHLGKFEQMLTGDGDYGPYNFYGMFSGNGTGTALSPKTKGGKPFFVTETGSNTFLAVQKGNGTWVRPENTQSAYRVEMKQTWWRQFLNESLLRKYPKLKGISFFEFIKFEDHTWRDFTNLGNGTNMNSFFGNDGGSQNRPTLDAFRADVKGPLGNLIIWADAANATSTTTTSSPKPTGTLGPNQGGSTGSAFETTSSFLLGFALLFLH